MRIRFAQAQVFYFPRDGSGRKTLKLNWQPLTLGTRTTPADLAGRRSVLATDLARVDRSARACRTVSRRPC